MQPKQSDDLSIIFFPNLPLRNLEEKVDLNLFNNAPELQSKINISLTAAHELQTQTVGQANNTIWKTQTAFRLTASTFGRIVKRKKASTPNFVSQMCKPKDLSNLHTMHNIWQRE